MEATRSRFGAPSRPQADAANDAKTEADDGSRLVGGGPLTERPMTSQQAVISRRAAIGAGLVGLGGLLLLPGQVMAKEAGHDESFVILLKGLYQPVVHGPHLGLSSVDLNDGSYSTTKIYPVKGRPGDPPDNDHRRRFGDDRTPGHRRENKAIGDFYVQFAGDLCAYDLPGGSIAMRFTGGSFTDFVPDGLGGQFLEGTFELAILEATRKFRPFVGGHNHMVDKLHALAPGDGSGGYNEFCFCFVSQA